MYCLFATQKTGALPGLAHGAGGPYLGRGEIMRNVLSFSRRPGFPWRANPGLASDAEPRSTASRERTSMDVLTTGLVAAPTSCRLQSSTTRMAGGLRKPPQRGANTLSVNLAGTIEFLSIHFVY